MEKMIINLRDVNIRNSQQFKEYVAYKEDLKFETNNRHFLRVYMPPEIKQQHLEISENISNISVQQLQKKSDDLIAHQKNVDSTNELVDHMSSKNVGNFNHFNSLWTPIIWQARENNESTKVKIGNNVIKSVDLGFIIASSLQQLDAEQDPLSEYYDWCSKQQKIEVDINTGGTTENEIAERNAFLGFLDNRETEIKRIVQLYAGSAFNTNSIYHEVAQEKLKFLVFKLNELRRLRERMAATKSHADKEKETNNTENQNSLNITSNAFAVTGAVAIGEQLLNQNANYLPEIGIGESFLEMRPNTNSPKEAKEKIRSAKERYEQTISMLAAMRNGMSKDEWLRSQNENRNSSIESQIRSRINMIRGWETSRYNEYSNA